MTLRRYPRTHLAIALVAALALGSAVALPVAASGLSGLFDRPTASLEVSGIQTLGFAGLMPGGRSATEVIELRASGSLTYRVRSEWSGSAELAQALQLTLTASTGRVIYQGPLDGAHVCGTGRASALDLRLADGQVETIAVSALLPLSAGNEVQGAELTAHLVVEATESFD
ncbi:MAG: hypothetical protein ACXWXS_06740 [Actinomycetota bacterium]